jgi:hypothetical protein
VKSLEELYEKLESRRLEKLEKQKVEEQKRFEEVERQRQFMIKDQLLYERLHSISTSNAAGGGSVSISVPTNLAITEDGSTLSWDSNYSNFEVWVSIDSAPYYLSGTTTSKTYNLDQPISSNSFNYKIRAYQGSRYSQFTNTVNFSWSEYWMNKNEVLFFGDISKIKDGKLYNQKNGATDYLTVVGNLGNYTFQCPNTTSYIVADVDYIWFNMDETQRTVTEIELINYDIQHTPVKYLDNYPNTIQSIIILSSSVTNITRDRLFKYFMLPIMWDNTWNDYGHEKENRPDTEQILCIPQATNPPTSFTSQFIVNTILGQLNWIDNSGGVAEYEVYSETNGATAVFLSTTVSGAITYNDTACKQNTSVVYKIRAKIGSNYTSYVTASTLLTPLCLKTNQSTLTQVVFTINCGIGIININWGDGNIISYSGNSTITHDYMNTGQYNISFNGDLNNITSFNHNTQIKTTGVITNWLLPSSLNSFSLSNCPVTGSIPTIRGLMTSFTMSYCNLTLTNATTFAKSLQTYNVSLQKTGYGLPTSEIDKLLKSIADWYEVNSPTQNCTFNLSGANMGIPTGGASNVDKVRTEGYYIAAGKVATITIRTS